MVNLRISSICILLLLVSSFAFASDFHLVIGEIYSHTVMSEEGARFVELYNPLEYSVDLSGWRLEILSSEEEGLNAVYFDEGSIIPTYGFFLIAISTDMGTWPGDWPFPDIITYDIPMDSLDSGVRLVDGGDDTVDTIGWGAVSDSEFYEEAPQINPAMGSSIERKSGMVHSEYQGNSWDTDNNFNDTYIREEPQPQNTDSPPEDPSASVQEHSIGILKALYGIL